MIKGIILVVLISTIHEVYSQSPPQLGWGNWTQCSKTCGTGIQHREKFCLDSDGDVYLCGRVKVNCAIFECDDEFRGQQWSDCSKECGGGGVRQRVSRLGPATQEINCHAQKCSPVVGNCTVDLVFLLDSSASIGEYNWTIIKQFTIDMIKGLKISQHQSRVGVVVFSPNTRVTFDLGQYDAETMEQKIWAIDHIAGGTNTAGGLGAMVQLFKESGREGVNKICILITDGISTIDTQSSVPIAEDAKRENGISLFVVAIGFSDLYQIRKIASKPESTFLHYSDDFSVLGDITDYVIEKTCDQTRVKKCFPCHKPSCTDVDKCGKFTLESDQSCAYFDALDKEIADTRHFKSCSSVKCDVRCEHDNTNDTIITPCKFCDYTHGQGWMEADNCHEYYICLRQPNGGVRVFNGTCKHLFWNQNFKTCVLAKPAESKCRSHTENTQVTTKQPVYECNLEQHPDDAHSFWVPNVASSIMKCKTGMFFSNSECTCIPEADDKSKCDTDPLLHFPYDEHLDDVTCRNAQAQKYGSGRIVFRSSGSRKFICLLGDAHMEVPFIRDYFAGQTIRKFSVSLWFKLRRKGVLKEHAGLVNNGDCDENPGFQLSLKNDTILAGMTLKSGMEIYTGDFKINRDWHMAVWTYNGISLKMYVDGILVDNALSSGSLINTDAPLIIGKICGDCQFNGCLDDLKLYSRTLQRLEVHQMYIDQ